MSLGASEVAVEERRRIQRDWVGHALQAGVIIAAIGIPMLVWANGVNTNNAQQEIRISRSERDIADLKQSQILLINQFGDAVKSLTKIETQLDDVRNRLNTKH